MHDQPFPHFAKQVRLFVDTFSLNELQWPRPDKATVSWVHLMKFRLELGAKF